MENEGLEFLDLGVALKTISEKFKNYLIIIFSTVVLFVGWVFLIDLFEGYGPVLKLSVVLIYWFFIGFLGYQLTGGKKNIPRIQERFRKIRNIFKKNRSS